jgi:hypothetical protein
MDNADLADVIEDVVVVNEIIKDVGSLPINGVVKQLRDGGWVVESTKSDQPKSKSD